MVNLNLQMTKVRKMIKQPVYGTKIDGDGFLISAKGITNEKPVKHIYKNKVLYFCKGICKIKFINAENKND